MKIFFSIFLFTFSQFLGAQNGSPKVEIKNIGPLLNSSFSDFAPLISADGSTMVFTSLRPTDKTNGSPNATAKKDGQKTKDANSAIFITYYNDKSKTWIEPIMLESVVNLSGVDNSAIALSNDGQRMLLYRSGNNKNINKGIFETTLKGNEWSVPKRLPAPINSDGNETSASFSPDGKTIYFVSSRPGGLGGRDIWYCIQNEAGDWGETVNIGDLINTKEDEESVFLHPNGSSLFFSSKGHNSTGGYDIFVSHLDTATNSWAKAINVGSPINTPGDDLYFVMAANEKTAYYASSKSKVLGDKDIFSITFSESILSKHITLVKGFVIGENGLGIESKIVVKEKLTGDIVNTFKSNKAIGKFLVSLPATGEYQINFTDDNNGTYTEFIEASENGNYNEVVLNIILEPKYANIFCRVLNEEGNPIPKVQIELIDIITKQLIGKFETNSAGGSRFSLPFETKFNIVYSKPGYLFQSVNVSIPKSSGSESKDIKDITLQKVEVGKKITINNVFFDFNQEIPQQQSFADLDRIIKLMNDMNSLQVEISGHTDNVGFQDNKKLSEQKAKAVMNYLVGKGCEKSRLKYKGYGSTDPIATNETAEGRQINSRIELKVLKVDLIAEQIAEEKRIESGSENVNVDVISPFPIINEEELISENKDSILAANKKDENFDAIKEAFGEEQSQENKDSTLTTLKKDEIATDTPLIVEEEKAQENKETVIAEVKKEETTTNTPIVVEEEKIQENIETVVTEVKKEETIADAPVVVEEEKVQEKETIVAEVKKEETIADAPVVVEEEKVQEKETIVAEVEKEETIADAPVVVEEEKIQENKETVIAEVKKEETITDVPIVVEEEKVQENKETVIAEVKKEETITDVPIVVEEEKVQENKKTIIADVKKDEKTTDTPIVIAEEEVQENKKTIIADVKKDEKADPSKEELLKQIQELAKKIDAMDQKYKARLDSIVNARLGTDPNKQVQENKETIIVDVKKEETTTDTPVIEEEKVQENKETVVAEVKKEETTTDTPVIEEEKIQENKETVVAEVKKEETTTDTPVIEEEKVQENKETVVAEVKKEETTTDTPIVVEEEKVQENKETIVAEVKKEETTTDTPIVVEEEKVQENKETVVAEVKKEETTTDTPIIVEEEKITENKDTVIANAKTVENEDTSKEALLKKNQELAKKIEALEQKHKAQLDSIVNASWGTDPNLAADEQDIIADSANLESIDKQTDTTVVAEYANGENSSANEENGEQSKIIADENADSTEDSLSMEIKNIGSLVNNDAPIETGENKTQKNKETIVADVKKDENTNDTPEVVEEEKIQKNKETVVADVKKDENTNDTPIVVEEEKIQENKETAVEDVKKDKNTNDIPIVKEEEKTQENKETVVAEVKKDENTNDTPVVKEVEKIQENKETVVADVKKDDAEQKYQARLDSIVNASWGSDPNEQVQENKETELATDKKDENTNDTPIITEEKKVQENKETVVADVKKDENTSDTPVVKEEEKIQENKETVVADVKKDDAEQKYQARLDSIVNASWGSDPNEQVQENKETELATDNKDENTNDTPVVAADKKETNNSGNYSRHVLESYGTDKKEKNTKPNKVEIIHEKQEPLEVVADKKEETADPAEEEQNEETKEATLAVNDDANAVTKKTTEATKSNNTSTLPERYKEFDKDVNGTITYDEIIKMIDSFFDDAPNVKQEDITSIIDYFFSD